ncbi:Rieske 2Fe-2S domain-containing protein [Dietzia cinnamea]|uniref:Rieske 2Fe-2S domain-containing protein n=1 Tax=Dietzia cinnamea TaxID=321318 RepID=A0ABV3YE88_9ACTN|nr:aromatic ring-hydroxylating dioxygenase subunit alpha [Dietzia cinnamea]MCT1883906.1 aromatic ring-hydroxylating dioxygenase subunit alpha [Dietzia cinnamea]
MSLPTLSHAETSPAETTAVPEPLPLPRGLTFTPDDWQILARYWYPVARSVEVTGGPLGATLLDVPLVVYRVGGEGSGEVVVADDICPHRGTKLSLGEDQGDGEGIRCPYHGLRFGSGGKCNAIPAHPGDKIPARMHLRSYAAVERYGLVWTCLAAAPGDEPAIPPVPHWDEPGFQQINCPWIDIEAFAGRQIEGFLDVGHFAFVHHETFADPENQVVPEYTPVPTADGFESEYWSTVSNLPPGTDLEVSDDFLWLRHYRLHVPFTGTLVVFFPEGIRLSLMNAASPVSATRTRLFDARCRNFDLDQPLSEVYDFNLQVFNEDRRIVEQQKPENLPLDPKLEVHIPADRSSIAYRRALRAAGLSEFFTA